MTLSLIVAYDRNRLIGADNSLPWIVSADTAHFKNKTLHRTVVMGRKTFDSIGKPLAHRKNVILTRDTKYVAANCLTLYSIESVLDLVRSIEEEVIIIGGSELYTQFLPYANKMYITEIDASFVGDSYFPDINPDEWSLSCATFIPKGKKTPYDLIIKEVIK
ncbi:dihydrofolate reductase [Paenibacillus lautus]|uniref:dihydrofolate reductase n=1 Tax=Paenibacillus lautus TaxID=1401 RepID=UPI00203F1A37|nr:dihydrofolate reductase [Paenibacillus lautus]MCM3257118.1 dihydrofolate reductase [Paenibacillus lautus]